MKLLYFFTIFMLLSACKQSDKSKMIKPVSENVKFNPKIGNITDFKTITFPSKDGLIITADLYLVQEPKTFILLCHQAGFSRGEYIETAKRLNKMGYSCMAIDQRSGKEVNGVINQTAKRALKNGLKTDYLSAKIDVESAIDYVYKLNNQQQVILVGSSYSASLSLILATDSKMIKAVSAFSPGEYLEGIDVANSIKNLKIPVFVTSSKKEIEQVKTLTKNVKSSLITHFKPEMKSIHGSRALWNVTKGNEACWEYFTTWLSQIK